MDTPTSDTVETSGQAALNALSGEQRAHYQLTGELPTPKAPEATTEPEDDDEPEPQATAKPEPTPEKPISKRQQQINDLIRRATESDLRAKALEAEITALKARQPAAEPKAEPTPAAKPAPKADSFPTFDVWFAQPGNEAKSFEDFIDERTDFRFEQKRAAELAERRQQSAKTEHEKRMDAWVERRDAFAAQTPSFAEKAGAFLNGIETGTPIGDTLVDSPVGPALALYLAEHPDVATRIARSHPVLALRELGKLEAQIESSLTSASASAGPAAKTVTTAPAPPMTLTPKAADPADDVESALASRDFRAYEAAQNRRDLARQ